MITDGKQNPPHHNNEPVILIHLACQPVDGIGPPMAFCQPYFIAEDTGANPKIPRVFCPACERVGRE